LTLALKFFLATKQCSRKLDLAHAPVSYKAALKGGNLSVENTGAGKEVTIIECYNQDLDGWKLPEHCRD